jgi:transposase
MRRYELTDDQWELIADLFPLQTMGRPRRSDRTVLNGILWILCSEQLGVICPSATAGGRRCTTGFGSGRPPGFSIAFWSGSTSNSMSEA